MLGVIRTYYGLHYGVAAALVLNLVLPAVLLACAPPFAEHDAVEASAKTGTVHSSEVVQAPAAYRVSFFSCPDRAEDRWECCDAAPAGFDRMVLARSSSELTQCLVAKPALMPLFDVMAASDAGVAHLPDRNASPTYTSFSTRVHLLVSSFLL